MRQRATFAAALILALPALPATGWATEFTVTSPADHYGVGDGSCGLREAITAANLDNAAPPPSGCPVGGGQDVITLFPGTYVLSRAGEDDTAFAGDLDINDPDLGETTTVRGSALGPTLIRQTAPGRVFDLSASGTTIEDLTITGGNDDQGGGVRVAGPGTIVRNSTLVSNAADLDAGSDGGAFYINAAGASLTVENSTIYGNSANRNGGGIFKDDGTVTIRNSTATANMAAGDGGFSRALSGSVHTRNTIVAGNLDTGDGSEPDCSAGLDSDGNTLLGTTAGCSFGTAPGDLINAAPLLAALADNGGLTQTVALLAGSPAIDKGAGCDPLDQRGLMRSVGGVCDIGSYERVLCHGIVVNRVGTGGDDFIGGTSGPDSILALGGDDEAQGFDGDDVLCGGAGADRLLGKDGNDLLIGGTGGDRLLGDTGRDRLLGQGGRDKLKGAFGKDVLNGGPGADNLNGGPGKDKLKGGPGKDKQRQ